MSRSFTDLCVTLAQIAADANHDTLAFVLKMAAREASSHGLVVPKSVFQFAGVWDWDVGNDKNYIDPDGAALFSQDVIAAANGLPNATYADHIHYDDRTSVDKALSNALACGGKFEAEYRVVTAGRSPRWISAIGHVTTDRLGRVIRFPGVMFDSTAARTRGN